jgi:hypothetical protein
VTPSWLTGLQVAANPYEAAHDDRPLGRMVAFRNKLDVAALN